MIGQAGLDAGRRDAPAVVLLHAIATDSSIWSHQVGVLQGRYRALAFDLPGHGRGTALPEGEPGIAALGQAVLDRCDALGVERAVFVGLSLGAMVAQWLAGRVPARVAGVVLVNGACTLDDPVRKMWRDRAGQVAAQGMEPQVEPTLARWFTPAFRQTAPDAVEQIARIVRDADVSGYVYAAKAIAALDQADLVGQIACPTLVVSGEYDQAAPPAAMHFLAGRIPGSRFASLPAAHLANIEAPVPFTQLVGDFLAEVWP